jgi:hypothetical protein
MNTPFAVAVLKAMNPFEWAEEELVSPVGFSSFQATCYSACELRC